MNAKQLIALAALAFAGSAAMAEDITLVNDSFVAQKTRAEVKAEAVQARAAQGVQVLEVDTSVPHAQTSTVTREQVRAELKSAPKARYEENEAA